ncbi:hypothetical protein BJ166DRAFT_602915 [Pestalotiopsis sp. NC0098]|nr:hypothetical protein BJ166DRAFT_602915 [Pestalotiopsis sp. NC0098]
MVRIAVAGASGQVAREIIDELVLTKKHEIILLSRNAPGGEETRYGVTWQKVDFANKEELVDALRGTHTVLSFIQTLNDKDHMSQKNLIDAAVTAGVKRLAPSEWGSARIDDMPLWSGKGVIREYLEKLNENGQVIEYSLFQPGMFLDYLASPHQTAKYVTPLNTMFDFENRRAITIDGHDPIITFTAVRDLAIFVAKAVEYEGTWPVDGGIRGNRTTYTNIVKLGEKICGAPFAVEKVKVEDLKAGLLKTSWGLRANHPSIPEEQAAEMLKSVLIGILLVSVQGSWDVSDEFNKCLLDFKFADMEEFLTGIWGPERF